MADLEDARRAALDRERRRRLDYFAARAPISALVHRDDLEQIAREYEQRGRILAEIAAKYAYALEAELDRLELEWGGDQGRGDGLRR